jgi:hypothetical protein
MIRFFVVQPTHLCLNPRFNICVIYLRLIILLVVGDIFVDSEMLFVTDFMNLKIKPTNFSNVLIWVGCMYVYL